MITESQFPELIDRIREAVPNADKVNLSAAQSNPNVYVLLVLHSAGLACVSFNPADKTIDEVVINLVFEVQKDKAAAQYEENLKRIHAAYDRDKEKYMEAWRKG